MLLVEEMSGFEEGGKGDECSRDVVWLLGCDIFVPLFVVVELGPPSSLSSICECYTKVKKNHNIIP